MEEVQASAAQPVQEQPEEILFRSQTPLGEREAYALADYTSRKMLPAFCIAMLACFAVLAVLGFLDGEIVYAVTLLVVGAVTVVGLAVALPRILRRNTLKNLLYRGAVNTVTATKEQIASVTEYNGEVVSSVRFPISSITKVTAYRGMLLVFVNRSQALIVGQDAFTVGSARGFCDLCAAHGIKTDAKKLPR